MVNNCDCAPLFASLLQYNCCQQAIPRVAVEEGAAGAVAVGGATQQTAARARVVFNDGAGTNAGWLRGRATCECL
jgi:hypothetical protein